MTLVPIKIDVRKRALLPIVEVRITANVSYILWLKIPLSIIDQGQNAGARLLPEEPTGVNSPNTVSFVLIFDSEQKAEEFCKTFRRG